MHLVDEQDDVSSLGLHFRQHRLQSFFELAAILRTSDERAHVERHQLFALEAFGHISSDDAHGKAFCDGGLADAGLADQYWIVFCSPRQHLHGPPDFLVAADDGIDFAGCCRLRQIAGISLERIEALFGSRAVGGAAFAEFVDGAVQPGGRDPGFGQNALSVALLQRKRLKQPLGRHERVLRTRRELFSCRNHAAELGRGINLPGATARDLGPRRKRGFDRTASRVRPSPGFGGEPVRKPFGIVEQNFQQMLRRKLLMTFAVRQILRCLDETLRPIGKFIEIHAAPPPATVTPKR